MFTSGCIIPFMSGCMVPEYQNPSGFSASYKRNLNALPLPEPRERLTQKEIYDLARYGNNLEQNIEIARSKKEKQGLQTVKNKGVQRISHQVDSKTASDPASQTSSDESDSDTIQIGPEEPQTRWQKFKQFFTR